MRKRKKEEKAMASAMVRGSADQSETPVGGPARAGNGDAASAMSQPPPANETEQVTASAGAAGAPQRAATVRQIDLVLGQIVAVLMRSPQHKHYSLADLEWLVLPAVLSGQFRIAQAQQAAAVAPVGVVLWASVSADVDRRLSDLSAPARLRPDEWRSGDVPWLMELVCDTRAQQALLKELGDGVFKGRSVKMRMRGADGKVQVGTLQGAARTP
jgi:hemolysin-activating ACP:hemolysin acyltransferase